jgi:hypothetical protein
MLRKVLGAGFWLPVRAIFKRRTARGHNLLGLAQPAKSFDCHDQHSRICPHYCMNENIIDTFWASANATTIADNKSACPQAGTTICSGGKEKGRILMTLPFYHLPFQSHTDLKKKLESILCYPPTIE